MMEKVRPVIAAELDKQGVVLLATYNFPIQTIWGVGKVTKLDDIGGLKMRVGNVPIAEFARRFGATPVTLATPDVAPALERGVVNSIVTASAGGGRLWGDMLHSNYRIPLNYDMMMLIANKAAFEKLTPEEQQKVRDAAEASAKDLTDTLAQLEDTENQKLKDKGVEITQASDADIQKARDEVKDFWAEWAKGVSPEAVKLLEEVQQTLSKP
jgi:TRAP-type C4-dicarboxylate transport system substrate-binding protein